MNGFIFNNKKWSKLGPKLGWLCMNGSNTFFESWYYVWVYFWIPSDTSLPKTKQNKTEAFKRTLPPPHRRVCEQLDETHVKNLLSI